MVSDPPAFQSLACVVSTASDDTGRQYYFIITQSDYHRRFRETRSVAVRPH